jgi:hypothetical protein
MIDPKKKLRQVLFSIHPLSYRIKVTEPPKELMEKKLFIEIIDSLKKIEDRRDFMQDEIGMDMTAYEDQFFHVIENLMKLHFNKEQLAIIQLYLYQLVPDKDWDGTITIEYNKKEKIVPFREPSDVWNVVTSLQK